jgi:hypothetical protein
MRRRQASMPPNPDLANHLLQVPAQPAAMSSPVRICKTTEGYACRHGCPRNALMHQFLWPLSWLVPDFQEDFCFASSMAQEKSRPGGDDRRHAGCHWSLWARLSLGKCLPMRICPSRCKRPTAGLAAI